MNCVGFFRFWCRLYCNVLVLLWVGLMIFLSMVCSFFLVFGFVMISVMIVIFVIFVFFIWKSLRICEFCVVYWLFGYDMVMVLKKIVCVLEKCGWNCCFMRIGDGVIEVCMLVWIIICCVDVWCVGMWRCWFCCLCVCCVFLVFDVVFFVLMILIYKVGCVLDIICVIFYWFIRKIF